MAGLAAECTRVSCVINSRFHHAMGSLVGFDSLIGVEFRPSTTEAEALRRVKEVFKPA